MLEEILSKLKSVESQIDELKNRSLPSQVKGLKKDNDLLKQSLNEIKDDNKSLIKRAITREQNDTEKQMELTELKLV